LNRLNSVVAFLSVIFALSYFVEAVLSQADEQLQQKYRMKAEGYDFEKLIQRVTEITGMRFEEILCSGKDRKRAQAGSILCCWATDRLGISQTELAQLLHLSQPAISQAVGRGRELVKAQSYSLLSE